MTNYISFDIEDWFHSHNLWNGLDRTAWDEYELRVVESTQRLLDILDEYETKATFFVLGHVAERAPELVREIERRGHELASHGYGHELLTDLSKTEIRTDIEKSIQLLEEASTSTIRGYRAPSFSITDEAADVLLNLGIEYDSSHFAAPVHDRYGSMTVHDSEPTFTEASNGLNEIQLPLFKYGPINIPWAGGGYFRFIPYPIYKRGVERISQQRDFVFYLHPWELDPGQPRVEDVGYPYRLRHYRNLSKTEPRLRRLLEDFDWHPISDGV